MCGIAGLVHVDGPSSPRAVPTVRAMLDRLEHRGPDGEGITGVEGATLGHRRLSIIDLAGGAQPLSSPSGKVWLVFNGEIYNYRELRAELESRGHAFQTQSDSEVLAAAIEEWGARCLPRLRGMFAFVAIDETRRTALLARDRLGKKPLYYALRGGQVGFSSELPSLLAWGAIERAPDPRAMVDFLRFGYVAAPRTAVADVVKMPAASFIELPLGAPMARLPEPRAYWSLSYEPKVRDHAEAVERVAGLLADACRDRLIADVPVGAFLSSGIDSSMVVYQASRLSREPLRTFTVGFDLGGKGEISDERPGARELATLAGTRHTERVVPLDPSVLPLLVRRAGEPLGDPSMVPTHAVASAAQGEVKVILTGDGGDESFAGYHRYARGRLSEAYGLLPSPVRKVAARALGLLGVGAARLHDAERRADLGPARTYSALMRVFADGSVAQLFQGDHRAMVASALHDDPLLRLHDEAPARDWLDRMLYTDLKSYLAEGVLAKADRMSMACSLEARAPLLDHRIVELAARLPASWKRPHGAPAGKALLREVAGRVLPPQIIRRPKLGFDLPITSWLREGPLRAAMREAFDTSLLVSEGWLDRAALRSELDSPELGRASLGNRLFSLYVLELWFREVLRGDHAQGD